MCLAGVNESLLPPSGQDHVDRLDAVASKIFQLRLDVLHAEREVMDALSSMRNELLQETALAQRLHQLNLHAVRIAELREAEALFGHIPPGHWLATQDVAEEHGGLVDLVHPNRNVVEALVLAGLEILFDADSALVAVRAGMSQVSTGGDGLSDAPHHFRKVDLSVSGANAGI